MAATPRQREGSPRRKGLLRRVHALLGEPGDSGGELSSPPRREPGNNGGGLFGLPR